MRREAVATRIGAEASIAVAARLADGLTLPPGGVIAGYWPLPGELDPRPTLERLAASGFLLALPRMQDPHEPLLCHAWRPGDRLIEGGFKVMEPEPEAPIVAPDVILVPLLAFDRRGHRLGYGKGYYDQTLAAQRSTTPGVLAIGLAFAAQEIDAVPVGAADQALDAIVTERAFHAVSCT